MGQLTQMATGELALSLRILTTRKYRQTPTAVNFLINSVDNSGLFAVGVNDGYLVIGACKGAAWFPVSPFCKIGATGYLVFGDINQDGVRDDELTRYWEIVSVTPAATIQPSRPDLCLLYAAPPSKLPRPLPLWTDNTLNIFFNINLETAKQYDISNYYYTRNYTTRVSMDSEIVPGVYEFLFPRLRNPDVPVKIPVTLQNIVEGNIKQGQVRQGFRITKMNGAALRWSADGFVEMDPRLSNTFEWEGNNSGVIFPAADSLHFSILKYATSVPLPGDPARVELAAGAFTDNYFPGFIAPGTPWVLMPTALQRSFTVPPGFIPVSNPAQEGLIEVTLTRSAASSVICTDVSTRRFQCPLRFVNTYEGWATIAFPYGTATALRASDADPDRDGFSNYQEWLANTNPMLASSRPASPSLSFVQSRSLRATSVATPGYWETKVTKAAAVQRLTYQYEFSTDLIHWSPIIGDDTDPDWRLIETFADPNFNTPGEIKVQSKKPKFDGTGFLRVKTTEAPEPPPPPADT